MPNKSFIFKCLFIFNCIQTDIFNQPGTIRPGYSGKGVVAWFLLNGICRLGNVRGFQIIGHKMHGITELLFHQRPECQAYKVSRACLDFFIDDHIGLRQLECFQLKGTITATYSP